ncbi:MAG TPA: zf-HC2 domain-containing protein [Thermomicrobiales bacterium]|nr:zf-HC2 domain-containing protein [Thermomicrobiales bacterium]
MASPSRGECRKVAPLLARYRDADLSEAERVLLSTHLLRCPACLARLDDYRRQDREVRGLPAIELTTRAHGTVLDYLTAASAPAYARATVWRQAAAGAAVATLALMLCASMLASRLGGTAGVPTATVDARSSVFAQPLTATFLTVNPTRAIARLNESAPLNPGAPGESAASDGVMVGTVRVVYVADGRLVLTLLQDRGDHWLTITGDTVVHLADGRTGTLADLGVGTPVRVRCGAPGGNTAEDITILR